MTDHALNGRKGALVILQGRPSNSSVRIDWLFLKLTLGLPVCFFFFSVVLMGFLAPVLDRFPFSELLPNCCKYCCRRNKEPWILDKEVNTSNVQRIGTRCFIIIIRLMASIAVDWNAVICLSDYPLIIDNMNYTNHSFHFGPRAV